jgi:hypothetical protein
VRGIEASRFFIDDIDRQNFVDRVTTPLFETGIRSGCFFEAEERAGKGYNDRRPTEKCPVRHCCGE